MNSLVVLDTEVGWVNVAGNIDGGTPDSLYGGIDSIDCGNI
jgi:hypothetical protein